MQIDIVSDTVCPWCFIGKRKLERALVQRPDLSFDVRWRAYRLDPTIPREGVDRKAYMKAKFGDNPNASAMSERCAAGASVDIAFAFDRIEKRPDTLDSHRLIRWSASGGKQNDVVERLFAAYFEQGRDIGDTGSVLKEIAADAGMDAELVGDLLAGDDDRQTIEQEDALAHRMGISGVPTFIFENKFMISGAHDADKLVRVIDEANKPSAS